MSQVQLDDLRRAHRRIADYVERTPVVRCPLLTQQVGLDLWFKCENLQQGGAFKARGACNAVLSLSEEQAARGVATHSSGNHAAALAWAAGLRSLNAHVVMPHNAQPGKLAAVRRLGVEPTLCEPDAASRQAAADAVVAATGATLVHPYDQPEIIAGQGTVALEVLEQMASCQVLVVPVGGGGLLAGCLIAVKSLRPDIKVIGAEPAWADDAWRSWKSGQRQMPQRYDSVADGLRTSVGELTFPVIQQHVDEILLASEERIVEATRLLEERGKLIVEPSGAVPLACVLEHAARFEGQRAVLVLSGGNRTGPANDRPLAVR